VDSQLAQSMTTTSFYKMSAMPTNMPTFREFQRERTSHYQLFKNMKERPELYSDMKNYVKN
jgi:hypothetical protein